MKCSRIKSETPDDIWHFATWLHCHFEDVLVLSSMIKCAFHLKNIPIIESTSPFPEDFIIYHIMPYSFAKSVFIYIQIPKFTLYYCFGFIELHTFVIFEYFQKFSYISFKFKNNHIYKIHTNFCQPFVDIISTVFLLFYCSFILIQGWWLMMILMKNLKTKL